MTDQVVGKGIAGAPASGQNLLTRSNAAPTANTSCKHGVDTTTATFSPFGASPDTITDRPLKPGLFVLEDCFLSVTELLARLVTPLNTHPALGQPRDVLRQTE